MLENWLRGIRTLKSVQLAAGSPRPTAADHIELSAGQIHRLNNPYARRRRVRFLMDASEDSGRAARFDYRSRHDLSRSVVDDFSKDVAELTEGTQEPAKSAVEDIKLLGATAADDVGWAPSG